MPLILRVTHYRNQPFSSELFAVFSAAGGTLGRAPGSDLLLDDPGKYISRTHARIDRRAGLYYLSDIGSNPSIVNDRPLGNGRETVLQEGDRLVVGDYQIQVAVLTDAEVKHPIDIEPEVEPEAEATTVPLFVAPPVPTPAPLPPLETPVPVQRDAGVVVPNVLPDALAGARILDGGSLLDAETPLADPLGLNLVSGPPGQALPTLDAPREERLMPAFRGAESDHLSPELQALQLPRRSTAPVPTTAVGVIPDDYDPLADFLPPPAPVLVVALEPVGQEKLVEHVAVPTAVEPETHAVVEEPVKPVAPVSIPIPIPVGDDAVLQALLRGLGIPNLRTHRAPVELAQLVGEMLREATEGTMDVLMARALTKRESHIDMTMIGPRSNNPLKFFPGPESALTQMLTAETPAYLAPVEAFGAAFYDVKAHELAVIVGMRAALAAVVQRFDPARIEQRLAEPGVFDKLLRSGRKARMWDRLVELYADLARDADEDLQRLFGEKFSVAYEEQVARLRDKH